jgi:predicted DNA-binding protein
MDKQKYFSIRMTSADKERLNNHAKNVGVTPTELVRTHIIKLIEYGTGLPQNTLNKQKSR